LGHKALKVKLGLKGLGVLEETKALKESSVKEALVVLLVLKGRLVKV
jgi:hypothetical protein